jgi:hypothetical protein
MNRRHTSSVAIRRASITFVAYYVVQFVVRRFVNHDGWTAALLSWQVASVSIVLVVVGLLLSVARST